MSLPDHALGFSPILHEDNEDAIENDIDDVDDHYNGRQCILCQAGNVHFELLDWTDSGIGQ